MSNKTESRRKNLPYIIFSLVGGVLLLSYNIVQDHPLWSPLLLNLGIVVIAVVVIEFLWKLVGGNPLLEAVKLLRTSTALLNDLEGSGIVRIYSERRKWEPDLKEFLHYVASAGEVDMMGSILRNNWMNNQDFINIVESRTQQKKCTFRILLLDPNEKSNILKQRSNDEAVWDSDDKKEEAQKISYERMKSEITASLHQLENVKSKLKKENSQYLEIRVLNQSNMYCSIIRADDKMIMSKYFLSVRGSAAPTIEIHGKDTSFYKKFYNEFEEAWKRGEEWKKNIVEES